MPCSLATTQKYGPQRHAHWHVGQGQSITSVKQLSEGMHRLSCGVVLQVRHARSRPCLVSNRWIMFTMKELTTSIWQSSMLGSIAQKLRSNSRAPKPAQQWLFHCLGPYECITECAPQRGHLAQLRENRKELLGNCRPGMQARTIEKFCSICPAYCIMLKISRPYLAASMVTPGPLLATCTSPA